MFQMNQFQAHWKFSLLTDHVPKKSSVMRTFVLCAHHRGRKLLRTGSNATNASDGLARIASALTDVKIAAEVTV